MRWRFDRANPDLRPYDRVGLRWSFSTQPVGTAASYISATRQHTSVDASYVITQSRQRHRNQFLLQRLDRRVSVRAVKADWRSLVPSTAYGASGDGAIVAWVFFGLPAKIDCKVS